MASSIREQIVLKMMQVLAGTTGLGTRIYRTRSDAFARGELPALVVRALRDESAQYVVDFKEKYLFVALELHVRSATADADADPILVSLHQKLLADPTLGALAIDVNEEETTFDLEDADQPGLVVTAAYRIYYRHHVKTLDA